MAKWWGAVILVAFLATSSVVLGACPNKCSGHGKCGLNDVCQCMQNWIGGDCSGRQCPFTRAWQDTAQRKDDAHYYAECGNRGTCDRTTGECSCDAGFVGSGCRRMQCPNDCSGHGTCEYIEELASDTHNRRIGGQSGLTYELWDQEKIMGCVCDGGFEGHDCSLRTCPKGDDPLTGSASQNEMVQAIVLDRAGGEGYLTYHDPYGNIYTTETIKFAGSGASPGTTFVAADDATTCKSIQTALRRLPNNVLNGVSVVSAAIFYSFTRTDPTDPVGKGTVNVVSNGGSSTQTSVICEVLFPAGAGTTGYQQPLGCHIGAHNGAGQHPAAAGLGNSGTCVVKEVFPIPVPTLPADRMGPDAATERPLSELAECSGRGTCDYTTGTCTCFTGHMGLACQSQEALV
ncbi:Tenascin [Phytophthora citrophthora]|uniref:Tenascin n=1 Tax=Phytophthora citrophthora TaxID=4793 RepID=A0AAD9GP54_9STRA|nr:Tenascin [Phytophthora citrophthora]